MVISSASHFRKRWYSTDTTVCRSHYFLKMAISSESFFGQFRQKSNHNSSRYDATYQLSILVALESKSKFLRFYWNWLKTLEVTNVQKWPLSAKWPKCDLWNQTKRSIRFGRVKKFFGEEKFESCLTSWTNFLLDFTLNK